MPISAALLDAIATRIRAASGSERIHHVAPAPRSDCASTGIRAAGASLRTSRRGEPVTGLAPGALIGAATVGERTVRKCCGFMVHHLSSKELGLIGAPDSPGLSRSDTILITRHFKASQRICQQKVTLCEELLTVFSGSAAAFARSPRPATAPGPALRAYCLFSWCCRRQRL